MFTNHTIQLPLMYGLFGAMTGVAINADWWWLLLFGCSGFLYTLITSSTSTSNQFWPGFLFSFSKILVVLSWGFNTYPIVWLGEFASWLALGLITMYWLLAAVTLSVAVGFATYACAHIKQTSLYYTSLIGSLFIAESLGALLYSIVFSGVGSTVQANFSFGFVGYGLTSSSYFLGLAAIAGVYGLSLFVYVICLCVAVFLQQRHPRSLCVLVVLLLTPAFFQLTPYLTTGTTVALISTNFTSESLQSVAGQTDKINHMRAAVSSALTSGAEHTILPEDSRYGTSFSDLSRAAAELQNVSINQPTYLYDSGRTLVGKQTVLRGYVFDLQNNDVWHYDKSYLVPQGEYMPYFATAVTQLVPDSGWKDAVFDHLSYVPSTETNYPTTTRIAPFLFCFEAINPFGVKQALDRHQAPFIVHPVSHSWFSPASASLNHQIKQMLLVQSVWNNVPIAVAGNEFASYVVYPDGHISFGQLQEQTSHWSVHRVEL